ncbi:class I SAM-dependent DNA methyltransferase [Flavobacterium sp. N1994]|uniref:class I SAM-dependent DNA methyltransferase n=1 Tax=Flavobacterium sp. N1994 TaxID=2986827 RepID=UPI0022214274|nr:class I SAM-dependent methyltransferase [Flavobacterium sp. N1994]
MDQTKIAVEVFNKLANAYQDKFMDVSLYHDSFDIFCNNIVGEKATVLELACGPGNITKYLLEKRPDIKILGTDLAPNMISLAKKNNPSANFELLDVKKIKNLNKKFDAIMCGFGLPYLSKKEAIQFITDSSQVLNANGVLYISTMEDDNSKSGFKKGSSGDEIFMNYHQEDYLTEALENTGFKIIELQRKNYLHNQQDTTDLIIIATK